MDMGPPLSKEVQLVSFHTVSKGYWGECGQRGGYFEMTNIPPEVCLFCNLLNFNEFIELQPGITLLYVKLGVKLYCVFYFGISSDISDPPIP